MTTVLDLSNTQAQDYFLESCNYCTVALPNYINFQPVLDFVKFKVGNTGFDELLRDRQTKPSELQDVNHQLLVRKEAEYTYRPIQLINPYLYYLLVKEITKPDAWKEIQNRFSCLSVENIEVTSIPKVKSQDEKSHKAADVVSWWEDVEQRSLELSLSYRYMFVTDITNCYSSIYTHTIAWALMDKDTAKKNRRDSKQLGNLIDKYLQAMQYGQTNGIPQGSVLSDFIAEMVLAYADKQLGDSLTQANIYDYHILRYRDDYRIFSDSKETIDKIVFKLQTVLSDLNLQLNSRKTFLTEDIVGSAIKPDKLTYVARVPIYRKVGNRVDSCMSNLQQEALFIHQFSKEYPNSGSLTKMLTYFAQRLRSRIGKMGNPKVLIAIVTDVALYSPKSLPIIISIISYLISELQNIDEQIKVVGNIRKKFERFPNVGELELWLQHITYGWQDNDYKEPLCRIVNGEPNASLWNNEWVADSYIQGFPLNAICPDEARQDINPLVDIEEVSLFDFY